MISLTTEAQEKLSNIVDSQHSKEAGVRVSVVRGPHGCVHGWSLGLEEDQQPEDLIFTFGPLHLLVEPGLADALEGAKIDYREDATSIGFTIDAPNSQGHSHGDGDQGGCGNH